MNIDDVSETYYNLLTQYAIKRRELNAVKQELAILDEQIIYTEGMMRGISKFKGVADDKGVDNNTVDMHVPDKTCP